MIGLNWPSEMDAESCRLSQAKRLIDQLPIQPAPRLTPSGPGHPGGNGIRIDAIGQDFRLQRHGKPYVPVQFRPLAPTFHWNQRAEDSRSEE